MKIFKLSVYITIIGAALYSVMALGATVTTLGEMVDSVVKSFVGVGQLMIATSYLAGIGFVIASVFKFKQHKDNPTNIPVGTPVALLMIGVVMIFLPGIITPVGRTVFGSDTNLSQIAGGFLGQGANTLPGGQTQIPSTPPSR